MQITLGSAKPRVLDLCNFYGCDLICDECLIISLLLLASLFGYMLKLHERLLDFTVV